MKRKYATVGLLIVVACLSVVLLVVGCSVKQNDFDVSGKESAYIFGGLMDNEEDIKNLVTDNEKLVINYFDSYLWIVFFDDENKVEYMTYIYEFDSQNEAESMIETRKQELLKNRSMTINDCKVMGKYIIVDLMDTSFNNINREILENNFNGLIIY